MTRARSPTENRSGGHFRIVSASLADGGPIGSADAERLIKESHHESLPPLDGAVTLTFDGETYPRCHT